jgi:hypothetical protein
MNIPYHAFFDPDVQYALCAFSTKDEAVNAWEDCILLWSEEPGDFRATFRRDPIRIAELLRAIAACDCYSWSRHRRWKIMDAWRPALIARHLIEPK